MEVAQRAARDAVRSRRALESKDKSLLAQRAAAEGHARGADEKVRAYT